MQLQLFDPAQCQSNGKALEHLFFSVYLPNQRLRNDAEMKSVGAVSDALRLCGDDRDHPDFHRFMAGVEKSGDPRARIESFVDTYRFAHDPKTAHLVAHLNRLDQIEGFRSQHQLSLGGKRGDAGRGGSSAAIASPAARTGGDAPMARKTVAARQRSYRYRPACARREERHA
jgi:hypothetical protein